MAALGEVPFRRYYGTVDATPLFVVLAGAYYERSGDERFAQSIWPHLERAPTWINTLFCRFPRRLGESPTLYPVACAPQSWASGAVFLLIESCLGLMIACASAMENWAW